MNDADFSVADVLDGIAAAQAVGLAPVKVNMVVKRGTNDGEIVPMARHFKGSGAVLRFIEYMDVGTSNGWNMTEVLPSADVVTRIAEHFPLAPLDAHSRGRNRPALGLRGRQRRDRRDFERHARVLRRLHAGASVDRRQAVFVPVRVVRTRFARVAAQWRERRRDRHRRRRNLAGPQRPLFAIARQPGRRRRANRRAAGSKCRTSAASLGGPRMEPVPRTDHRPGARRWARHADGRRRQRAAVAARQTACRACARAPRAANRRAADQRQSSSRYLRRTRRAVRRYRRGRYPARFSRTAGRPARRAARGRHRVRAERALRLPGATRRSRRPPRTGIGLGPSRHRDRRDRRRRWPDAPCIPSSRCCARRSPTTLPHFWTPASARFARGTHATGRSKSSLPTSARFTISIRYKNSPTSNVTEAPVDNPAPATRQLPLPPPVATSSPS